MGYDIGPKIGIEGESEFRRAIQQINTSMKTLGTEMAAVTSAYDLNDKSIDSLTAQNKVLNKQIDLQKSKLEELKSGLSQAASKYGENDRVTQGWQQAVNKATADLNKMERQLGQNAQTIKDYGNNQIIAAKNSEELKLAQEKLKDAFKVVAAAAAVGGAAVLAFTKKGIDLASDLQEVQNVVDTTFGSKSSVIDDWSKKAAQSFGMSELSAKQFNGTLGAMLKSMGLTSEEVLNMSTAMVGLSGDMASFYNLDIQEAFEKIRSGISGETEPLKQLGINMSVANLQAFSLSQGIKKSYDKMSQSEQVMLRYNYLMKATADAQGDFAKTSDSYANQQRILKLELDNLAASLGQKLLPQLNALMPKVIDYVQKLDLSKIEWIFDHGEELAKCILGIGAAFVTWNVSSVIASAVIAIQGMVTAIKAAETAQLAFNAVMATNPIGLTTLAISGAIVGLGALAIAISKSKTETDKLIESINKDKQAWEDLQKQQETNIATNTAEIDRTQALWTELQTLVDKNGQVVGSKERVKFITEEINALAPNSIAWIDAETLAYTNGAEAIENMIAKKRAQIVLEAQEPAYKEAILNLSKKEQEQAKLAMDLAAQQQTVEEALASKKNLTSFVTIQHYNNEKAKLEEMQGAYAKNESTLGSYYATISNYENDAAAIASDNFEKIKVINAGTATSHKDTTNATAEELKKQAAQAQTQYLLIQQRYKEGCKGITKEMVAEAKDTARKAKTEYEKVGDNIVEGTKKGVNNKKGGLVTTVTEMAKEAIKAARKALDIHSPSRVFMEIGENVVQGLVNGIESCKQLVIESAKDIGEILTSEEKRIQKKLEDMDKAAIEKQEAEATKTYKTELAKKYAELAKAEKGERKKIQDEIAKLQSDREKTLAENSEKALRESLDNQLKIAQNFKKEYQDAVNEVLKDQENMSKKLSDFGDLFERTKSQYGDDTFKIRDLQKDIEQINSYGKALEDLKAKGAPKELIAEIQTMSIQDGLDYAKSLVTMTDQNYTEYIAQWTAKQEAAKKVAQQFYSGELSNLKTEFVDKIPTELSTIKDQMKDIGMNSAFGLARGFREQKEYITDTFVNVLESALSAAKKSMDIHSPSRRWAEVGKFMAQGLGVGFVSQMQGVVKQINNSIPSNVTTTGQYQTTAKMGESVVNGIAAVMPQANSQPITIPVILDGKTLAQVLYDPLTGVAKQRGVSFGET